MAIWKIDRKATAWETTTIEADTYEEAFRIAQDDETEGELSWAMDYDSWDLTGDYWGQNQETNEAFVMDINGVFQAAI